MAVSFTPLQLTLDIAHCNLRLVCGYSVMETHFTKLPTASYCVDVASRGSLELGSECCNQGQTIIYFLACVAYHIAAEPLLLLGVSTSH